MFNEQNKLVVKYDHYLDEIVGLSPATRLYRRRYATEFLKWFLAPQTTTLNKLTFIDVSSYIIQRSTEVSLESTSVIACSLNSFIRFLSTQGLCSLSPCLYVPHPKLQHKTLDNKTLSIEEINLLFQSINQETSIGQRDFAIMHCLTALGLRTSEVAGLKLRDIDWHNKVITINSTKLKRQQKLPVPRALMSSLISYIVMARPESNSSFVFVYHQKPLGQPITASTVRSVARRAFARAGFPASQSQVHRIRHTVATQLLANNVPLKVIADILGHQCIDTTTRYTFINQKELLSIALPWPEGDTL